MILWFQWYSIFVEILILKPVFLIQVFKPIPHPVHSYHAPCIDQKCLRPRRRSRHAGSCCRAPRGEREFHERIWEQCLGGRSDIGYLRCVTPRYEAHLEWGLLGAHIPWDTYLDIVAVDLGDVSKMWNGRWHLSISHLLLPLPAAYDDKNYTLTPALTWLILRISGFSEMPTHTMT